MDLIVVAITAIATVIGIVIVIVSVVGLRRRHYHHHLIIITSMDDETIPTLTCHLIDDMKLVEDLTNLPSVNSMMIEEWTTKEDVGVGMTTSTTLDVITTNNTRRLQSIGKDGVTHMSVVIISETIAIVMVIDISGMLQVRRVAMTETIDAAVEIGRAVGIAMLNVVIAGEDEMKATGTRASRKEEERNWKVGKEQITNSLKRMIARGSLKC